MYDLHAHILPGIDDGATALDESLAMARRAAADGTRVLVATPHHKDVTQAGPAACVASMVDDLNRRLTAEGIDLRLVSGMEVHLYPETPAWAKEGSALTINGSRYILVELNFYQYPLYTDQVLYELQLQGLTPIIAHPERQATIQDDPSVLENLVQWGVLTQVTAGSLVGAFGPGVRRVSQTLLKRGLVHVLASDAHRARGPRAPGLTRGREEAERLVGEEEAWRLVLERPRAIVEGRPVEPPDPRPQKARSWWPLFR